MTTQVVRPAGAGHESLWVAILSLTIILLAAAVISLRSESQEEESVAAHQIDARRDLNAAEQGIHTELVVAFDEILMLQDELQALPKPQQLAAEGVPPFTNDTSTATRGHHVWQLLQVGDDHAYQGLSGDSAVAGSFLLLPSAAGADIWLNRAHDAAAPHNLHADALITAGWRQVASQYDAGVTRQHRH
ncbi:DUF6162 family protein [Ectopseudomonas chengduensis]|nr:DUF6162 family protein [Pseudomonas chengduensis]WKC37346.1 DUF6162 family protein [Pseudomonas chengduensis]